MLLDDLVDTFRVLADDIYDPVGTNLWSPSIVEGYADQAEIEACSRKPLLMAVDNATLCTYAVDAGDRIITKHPAIRRVFYARFTIGTSTYKLDITNRDELTYKAPDWEELTGTPQALILEDTTMQVVPEPTSAGTLNLEVSHIPLVLMSAKGSPTIDTAHHYQLVYWMLHLAFSRRDADTYDAKKALNYDGAFSAYFGDPPNAYSIKGVRDVRLTRDFGGWI